jgi:hypothetical protein
MRVALMMAFEVPTKSQGARGDHRMRDVRS